MCRRPIHSWLNKFSRKIISLLLSLPICEMWAVSPCEPFLSHYHHIRTRLKGKSLYVSGLLPAPHLSLEPLLPIYLQWEEISLICSPPQGEEATSYRFFNNEMGEISEGVSSQSGKGQVVTAVQGGNAGVYTCQYSREESGEKILSGDSNSIQIPVVGKSLGDNFPSSRPHSQSDSLLASSSVPCLLC